MIQIKWTTGNQIVCSPPQVDLRVENIEPLLKHIFGHKSTSPDEEPTTRDEEEDGKKSPMKERRRRKAGEGNKGQIKERRRRKAGERDSSGCSPSIYGYLSQVRTMVRLSQQYLTIATFISLSKPS